MALKHVLSVSMPNSVWRGRFAVPSSSSVGDRLGVLPIIWTQTGAERRARQLYVCCCCCCGWTGVGGWTGGGGGGGGAREGSRTARKAEEGETAEGRVERAFGGGGGGGASEREDASE